MDQIVGQSRAIDILLGAYKAQRLHHASIFHGPQGVGKFTCARAMAKLLLCHSVETDLAGTPTACGACVSCARFSATPTHPDTPDNHPDLHIISKELARFSENPGVRSGVQKTIAVDILRQFMVGGEVAGKAMSPVVSSRSQLQKGRVFIIDEAELMAAEGQNAILKTMEEPPEGVRIILVTSNENKLLPTIRSRCQRVPFLPIPDAHVQAWVQAHPQWTGSPQDLEWLIGFASGSLGRAQLAVDYNLVEWSRELLPMLRGLPKGEFSPQMGARMGALMSGFAELWVKTHKNASKESANRLGAELMWLLITQQMRRAIKARASKLAPGSPQAVEQQTLAYVRAIEAIDLAERELNSNLNINMVCDHAVSLLARALAPGAQVNA